MNSIHSSSCEVVIRHLRSVPLQLVKFAKIRWHKDLKNKFVKFVKFVVQKKTKCYERKYKEDTEEGGGDCDYDHHRTAHHAGRSCRHLLMQMEVKSEKMKSEK